MELRQGRVGDPARGRQTFRKYVEERWLPNHVLEPTTREKYTYYLGAHIFPELGRMRMTDIFPEHIREWISQMQREGQSAWTIQYCKSSILNSIFTTALNDQVTYIHPCRGVKIPTVPATPRTIITPEQFDACRSQRPQSGTSRQPPDWRCSPPVTALGSREPRCRRRIGIILHRLTRTGCSAPSRPTSPRPGRRHLTTSR